MNKRMVLPMLGIVALSVFGCDLFEAPDVNFDVKLPLDFVVDEGAVSSTPVPYDDTKQIKATDNPDVAKYKDKIKSFKVNKVTYEITDYVAPGPVTFTNGSLTVASTGKTIASASSVDLTSTAETELNASTDGFNALGESLKQNQEETIMLKGTFSSTPVAFKVRAYFYMTISAKPL